MKKVVTPEKKVSAQQVGLGNVDNTADKDKSVKYAESAGSATNDSNGKKIADTYLPLGGGILKGELVETKGHKVHYVNISGGQAGYAGIAKFTITGQYQDQPIELKIINRGQKTPTVLSIRFSTTVEKDPGLAAFNCMGTMNNVYMHKADTSVWILYVKKTAWDAIDVMDISKGSYNNKTAIEWLEEFVEELPDGAVQAEWGYTVGNSKTADSAEKVGSSTVGGANKPVYLNNGKPTACNTEIPTKTSQLENDSGYISGSSPEMPYGNDSGGISVGIGLVNSDCEETYTISCTPDVVNTGGSVQTGTLDGAVYYYITSEWASLVSSEYDGKKLDSVVDQMSVNVPDYWFSNSFDDYIEAYVFEYDSETRKSRIRFYSSDDYWLEEYASGQQVIFSMALVEEILYQSHFGNYNLERSGNKSVVPILSVGNGSSDSARSNALRLTHTSQMYLGTGGKYNATGADYGEYFEWLDGNGNLEDRRGLFVSAENGKIRIAKPGDFIIGAVSRNASVIGNSDEEWQGRYLKDDFGEILYRIQDENGIVKKVPVENPEFNPELAYIPRSERPEWDVIGLYGRVRVIDNGLCEVGSSVTVGEDGTAVPAEMGFPVFGRISENVIEILYSWGIALNNLKESRNE